MDGRTKRFRVALSFPGEHRDFVERVAGRLAEILGRERVLYDRYYEAELARPDLDLYLQRLYHDQSELIAVFLCAEYARKEWCGLEWGAVRDLIKQRQTAAIMPFRFDTTEIPGLFSTHGYVWIGDRTPKEMAELILERLQVDLGEAAGGWKADDLAPHCLVHLPYPSLGDLFRGRDESLDSIGASLRRLTDGNATAIVSKALHGLGGERRLDK